MEKKNILGVKSMTSRLRYGHILVESFTCQDLKKLNYLIKFQNLYSKFKCVYLHTIMYKKKLSFFGIMFTEISDFHCLSIVTQSVQAIKIWTEYCFKSC